MDYLKLGRNEKERERRFKVLLMLARGATPPEIAKSISKSTEKARQSPHLVTIYRDIKVIKDLYAKGDDTPLAVIQGLGETFFQAKIRELEMDAKAMKDIYPNVWMGLQKLIVDMKEKDLKLKGAFIDKAETKVEHSGGVAVLVRTPLPERKALK